MLQLVTFSYLQLPNFIPSHRYIVTTLQIYKFLCRLEKLIVANKSNVATVVALDGVIGDLEDGFKAGYEDAGRILAAGTPAGYVQLTSGAPSRPVRSALSIGEYMCF